MNRGWGGRGIGIGVNEEDGKHRPQQQMVLGNVDSLPNKYGSTSKLPWGLLCKKERRKAKK